jgi:hypothetical protein
MLALNRDSMASEGLPMATSEGGHAINGGNRQGKRSADRMGESLHMAPPRLKQAAMGQVFKNNALSLVLFVMFVVATVLQVATGLGAYNEERLKEGRSAVDVSAYLSSGHFLEAFFENWESEFLQMAVFVVLSASLIQKGSAESKPPDEPFPGDEDPRLHERDPAAPWPVRRGGWVLWMYERSLSIAFAILFVASFSLHAVGGHMLENEQRLERGEPPESLGDFMGSNQFWFESF